MALSAAALTVALFEEAGAAGARPALAEATNTAAVLFGEGEAVAAGAVSALVAALTKGVQGGCR
jgi:hypothetical protein